MGLFIAVGQAATPDASLLLWAGGGLILGGAAAGALGWYMNIARPAKKADEWIAQRSAQLGHLVQTGQFQLAPGLPLPTSLAQAQQQADQLLATESERIRKGTRNVHTIWFIPMQWVGAIGIVIGVFLLIAGFVA